MTRGISVPTDAILHAIYLTHAAGILVGGVYVAVPFRDLGDVLLGGFFALLGFAMGLALYRYRAGRYDAERLVAPGPDVGVRRRCRDAREFLNGDDGD